MKAVIDRIEGDLAVVLVGEMGEIKFNIPISLLPEGCKEGEVLGVSFERDQAATAQAKERVTGLMDKLKQKSQGKTGLIRNPGS